MTRVSYAYGVVPPDVSTSQSGLVFLKGMIDGRYPAPPICETVDFWLASAEHGRAVFEAEPSPRVLNPLGTVHGGWISTLLDSAMGCAVHSTLKPGYGYTTVDMTVTFVKAVLPSSGRLTCEGKIIHSGGRIATSEGRLFDASGKLMAHGTETCLILAVPAPGDKAASN